MVSTSRLSNKRIICFGPRNKDYVVLASTRPEDLASNLISFLSFVVTNNYSMLGRRLYSKNIKRFPTCSKSDPGGQDYLLFLRQ